MLIDDMVNCLTEEEKSFLETRIAHAKKYGNSMKDGMVLAIDGENELNAIAAGPGEDAIVAFVTKRILQDISEDYSVKIPDAIIEIIFEDASRKFWDSYAEDEDDDDSIDTVLEIAYSVAVIMGKYNQVYAGFTGSPFFGGKKFDGELYLYQKRS